MNFIYRAGAVGFGGHMTRPIVEAPPAQASVSLPAVGGYASASVNDYTYCYAKEDLVSFRSASCQVVGSEVNPGLFATQATVTIEGLRVLGGLLTADTIVGRLTSLFPPTTPPGELPMLPDCSHFWNLRIDGRSIDPKVHPGLVQQAAATKSAVDRLCSGFCDPRLGKPPAHGPAKRATYFSIFDEDSRNRSQEQLAKSPSPKEKHQQGFTLQPGWRIDIPDFGKVYLGEYFVFEDRRLLIMMRLEMGSPRAGELILGSVEGNGVPV